MPFAIDKEHRDFFRLHRWMECEEVITPQDQTKLHNEINRTLGKRFAIKSDVVDLAHYSTAQIFAYGRDLWREEGVLKKSALSRSLAAVAADFTDQRQLRIAYDQLLISTEMVSHADRFSAFLETTPTLEEMSGVQGVLCGTILCIKAPSNTNTENSSLFPTTAGSAIFLAADCRLPLPDLKERVGGIYWLIVYASSKAVYLRKESDPHMNAMQRLGYQFGDRLSDLLNPLVHP